MLRSRSSITGGFPLAFLREGEEGEIIGVRCGWDLAQRLADIGFIPSTRVKMISANSRGPVLVEIRGSRIALWRGVAMKIIVNGVRE
ncbi:MAG: FeoA family protein [Candidatus Syntropharchaeia archaeon]